MSTSTSTYQQLTDIIATRDKGVKITYPTSSTPRLVFPKALGQTNNADKVICAVMEATTTTPVHYSVKSWRCFNVIDLVIGNTASDIFSVPIASERPNRWKAKQLLRQNCIDDVDVFR